MCRPLDIDIDGPRKRRTPQGQVRADFYRDANVDEENVQAEAELADLILPRGSAWTCSIEATCRSGSKGRSHFPPALILRV